MASNEFEKAIAAYLEEYAATDECFAKFYNREDKNINDCCNYILTQVKASRREGFSDEEIYGMAVHYYEEDNDKLGKVDNLKAKVVVNHTISLSDSEKAEAKKRAMDDYYKQEMEKIKNRNKPKVVKQEEESGMLSLF